MQSRQMCMVKERLSIGSICQCQEAASFRIFLNFHHACKNCFTELKLK